MAPVNADTTVVLITGANQGIGYYTAKQLAFEQSNYHIVIAGRNSDTIGKAASELQIQGLSVEPIVLDLNSDESIAQAAKEVGEKYGRLDVLISNAGITHRTVNPEGKSRRMIMQAVFDTNVFGTRETIEAFLPLLSKSIKTPRIVFISTSSASLQMRIDPTTLTRRSLFPEYPVSKAALNMLCLHYAVKYEKEGWKVNACCPGHCKTNLNGFTAGDPPDIGAQNACRLATLGEDGETGTFSNRFGLLPW